MASGRPHWALETALSVGRKPNTILAHPPPFSRWKSPAAAVDMPSASNAAQLLATWHADRRWWRLV